MRTAERYEIECQTLQVYASDDDGRIPDQIAEMLLHRMQRDAFSIVVENRKAEDPSIELRFEDDSIAIVSNPAQKAFPMHVAEACE